MNNSRNEYLRRRRKVFGVKAKKDGHIADDDEEFVLSVTHNGYQWQGIALLPEEARKIIKALNEYLEAK